MEDGFKHYIRINSDNQVIKSFSTAFEQPQDDDILIAEDAGRHYNLDLFDANGCHLYKYVDSTLTACTSGEIATELAAMPAPPVGNTERIELLQDAVDFILMNY